MLVPPEGWRPLLGEILDRTLKLSEKKYAHLSLHLFFVYPTN